MNVKKNAFPLLCLLFCLLFAWQESIAQTTVTEGTYDLQFKPPTVDCTGEVPVYCVVVQIRSAIPSEQFAIGAHTVYINFDPNSIQFNPGVIQPYTSLNFGDGTRCALGNTQIPYFDADFDFINFQSDGTALGEGNMTTNMQLPNFGCPLVTDQWMDVGEFCFEIIDLETPTSLVFNTGFTLINLNSNVPAHTQGDLDDSAVQAAPACVQCPSTAGFTPASGSEDLCSSSLNVNLPSVPITGTGSDNAIYTWSQVSGPVVTIPAGDNPAIALQSNTSCVVEEYAFNLTITCSDDPVVSLDGGTYNYRVYPAPTIPSISIVSQGASCTYAISAACPDLETLSDTNVPSQSAGSSGEIFPVTVSNGICGDVPFNVAIPSCDDACPVQTEVITSTGQTDVCTTENTVQLPNVTVTGENSGKAIFTWSQTAGPTVTVPAGSRPSVTLEANNSTSCEIVTYTFSLSIGCTTNAGTSLVGGTFSYNVYPEPGEPEVTRNDDVCTYSIATDCAFETTTSTVDDKTPGDGETTLSVSVSNPACAAKAFDVTVSECPAEPIACPLGGDVTSFGTETIDLCAGQNTLDLPSATVGGSNAGNATYSWTQTAGPTVSLDQVASPTIQIEDYTGCGTETYTFSLTIGCAEDASISIDGGTVTYEMYGIPQAPEVRRDNDNCDYTIVAVCPDDEVTPATVASTAPGTEPSSITLTVINNNCPDVEEMYNVNVPACPGGGGPTCPTTGDVDVLAVTAELCGDLDNSTFQLNPSSVSGSGAANATFSWSQTSGASVTIGTGNSPEINLPENTSCSPEEFVFSLTVGCSEDASVSINAGSISITSFPVAQAPTVQKTSETCSYVFVPNCQDDVLSPSTIPNQTPPSIGQTIDVTVSNTGCSPQSFTVNIPDCSEPTSECAEEGDIVVFDEEDDICGTNASTVTLPNPSFGNSTATYSWTQTSGPIIDIPDGTNPTLTLGVNTSCSEVVYSFRLTVGCSEDPSVSYDGGIVSYTVYPRPQAPSISRISGDCAYVINNNCNDDILSVTSIPNKPPGFLGEFLSIEVSNRGCSSLTYQVTVPECPEDQVDCPLQTDITSLSNETSICNNVSGNAITLPVVPVGGAFSNKGVFTWTQIAGPTVSVPAGASPTVTLLQNTSCDPVNYIFSVSIGCTDDASLSLIGGTIVYTLYPEPNTPVITKIDDVCNYSIFSVCPTDVLLPASVPSFPVGTIGETFNVTVNNAFCTKSFSLPVPSCIIQTTDCPLQSEVVPYSSSANQLCNNPAGNEITLPNVAVNGEFAVNATFTWTQSVGPNVAVGAGAAPTIFLPQNSSCEGVSYTFKLTVGCTDDATLALNGGEITFVVYPEPLAPTVTRLNATCEYSIEPACSGDILSTASIPAQDPGTDGATISIEVSNAGCSAVPFELAIPACPSISFCPDQAEVTPVSISDEMCISADLKMPLPYAVVSGSNAANASFTWEQTSGPEVEILAGDGEDEIVLGSNETCEAITYTFALRVGCLEDEGISLNGGAVTYIIYPAIEAPTLVRLNEVCEYRLTTACPNDIASPDPIPNQAPGTSGNTIDVDVTREGCSTATFTLEIPECTATAVPCPIAADIQEVSGSEEFCGDSEYEVSLPAATVTGAGATKAVFTWTQLEGPSVSIDGGATPTLLLSNDLSCDVITYTFQLTVGCIDDGDISIDAGTVTYIIYPMPQAPILENDGFNNFTVVPACENDETSPTAFSLEEGDDNKVVISVVPGSSVLCPDTDFELEAEILSVDCPAVECRVIYDQFKTIYYILVRASGGLPEAGTGEYTLTLEDGTTSSLGFDELGVLGPFRVTVSEEFVVMVSDDSPCDMAVCSNLITTTVDLDLIDFSGEAINTGNLLSWTTANEVDHDFFTLHRSTDGSNFIQIATVDGKGIDLETTTYEWMDKEAPAGISYYRLDMTDTDGNTVSSTVISIVRGESNVTIINVLPIPASEFLHLDFVSPIQTQATINIYDYAGKLVHTKQVDEINNGLNSVDIDVQAFSTGVYLLTLQIGDEWVTKKFVKE